jgi:CxxC motif-containing protein (DUF1111 family)
MPQSAVPVGLAQSFRPRKQFYTKLLFYNTVVLGQRIFFLHDGRTTDLLQAILAHSSPGSEANGSIAAFNSLNTTQKQDILNFLRSL